MKILQLFKKQTRWGTTSQVYEKYMTPKEERYHILKSQRKGSWGYYESLVENFEW